LISAVSPSESAGQIDIVVTTPEAPVPFHRPITFNFLPTVTGLSPNGGSKAGGTSVTITGTGFAVDTTATVFKFETATATSVNCTSTTRCTVVSPAHAVGTVDVKAKVNKTVSPKNRPADQFTYN